MHSANDYDSVGGRLISYGNPSCLSRCFFWNKDHVLARDLLSMMERAYDVEYRLISRFSRDRQSCMECSKVVKHVFCTSKEWLDHMRRGSQSGVMRTAAQARISLAKICIPFDGLKNVRAKIKELYRKFSEIMRLTETKDQRARFYQEALVLLRRFIKVKKAQLRDVVMRLKDLSRELHAIKICINEACELDTLAKIPVWLFARVCRQGERRQDSS
jgi:hypothetical protein